ncbi:hypothetical protein PINS_up006160 [Pythium insidiosum]|nr:hypothetical protein PINS_up006160 [Pythium insidiosum]
MALKKRLSTKSSRRSISSTGVGGALGLGTAPTLSSEANARAVTRSEFQALVAAVSQLEKQTQRQLSVDAQVGNELQVFAAEVASNKSTLGKLAQLVLEKTNELQERVTTQLQQLQVESHKRLTDVALAIERLEFRFKHHVRDCQTVAEQVDAQRDALANVKSQLGQTQLLVEQQRDDQRSFVETVQYSIKTSEDKIATATADSTKSLEAFQQRVIAFVKGVETSTQDALNVVVAQTRDLELQSKRQKNILHQVKLGQLIGDADARCSRIESHCEELQRKHSEDVVRVESLEHKTGAIVALVERRVDRDDVERIVERTGRSIKQRVEAVLELVHLCVQATTSSSTLLRLPSDNEM